MAYPLIVLDASAAMALLLAEEQGDEVAELLRGTIAVNGQVFVPALFWYELGNGLLAAQRTGRITAHAASAAVSSFNRLPFITHLQHDFPPADRVLSLARKNQLTYYDASYLELALRFDAPLKSFDSHLRKLKASYPLIL